VLINACKPHKHLKQFPQATLLRQSTYERGAARWNELGFEGPPPKPAAFHKD
jgi:4-hydroxy-3-polyprenylbenzoate decarboxylase